MDDHDDIVSVITNALRPVIEAALARAKDEGRREAAEEFKAKVEAMFNEPMASARRTSEQTRQTNEPKPRKRRASSGTVKPLLISQLTLAGAIGMSMRDLAEATGVKYNTVRGTLWLLKKDGAVFNRHEKWFVSDASIAAEDRPTQSNEAPEGASRFAGGAATPSIFG